MLSCLLSACLSRLTSSHSCLYYSISTAKLYHIWCIRSTQDLEPGGYDPVHVLGQVRHAAICESAAAAEAVHPHRIPHIDFLARYQILHPHAVWRLGRRYAVDRCPGLLRKDAAPLDASGSPNVRIRALLKAMHETIPKSSECKVGLSSVFFGAAERSALERARRRVIGALATRMQVSTTGP